MAARRPKSLTPVRRTTPDAWKDVEAPERVATTVSEQKINQYRKRRYQALHAETDAANKRRAAGKATARDRIEMLLDEGSFVELDVFATHRAQGFGMEDRRIAGDGVVAGLRRDRPPPGRRLRVRRDRLRRLAGRGDGREDRQGPGARAAQPRADHRHQRFGRRAHPGRSRRARRLRRHLLPQRALVGRDPADQRHRRAVHRRRGLLAGDHRLHLHRRRPGLHVHHRARR